LGDTIKIKRKDGEEFEQEISSMQIDHNKIEEAGPGDEVGMKMKAKVSVGDLVYKV